MSDDKAMKPIWFFVGLMMIIVGGIIFIAGLYLYFNPGEVKTALANTYPNLWWGGIMVLFGMALLFIKEDSGRRG